ncbi:MAG: Asp-tRNA(Asn)/Glu-tRNA(Gln) amidotransferase subunit GatC [Gammaproteobacteria bacterium]|nr:Asp-tRNA(Asn)/Glu-tRNA(Gln) amidotransferase subunit GatC [Gammaproteobacteria bacterium]
MSLTTADVEKIAHLAKLTLSGDETPQYAAQLSNILDLVEQMNQVNTDHIEAIAHALEFAQRERPDVVTEPNQREVFQEIAPAVEAGLYLVPKVIEMY